MLSDYNLLFRLFVSVTKLKLTKTCPSIMIIGPCCTWTKKRFSSCATHTAILISRREVVRKTVLEKTFFSLYLHNRMLWNYRFVKDKQYEHGEFKFC